MQPTSTQYPFTRVSFGQQPFGIRVSCVLDASLVNNRRYFTGLAIEATGGMQQHFGWGPFARGVVQDLGQHIGSFLGKVDLEGGTSVVYWGTNDASTIQSLGYRTAEQWQSATFNRPLGNFGRKSCILPALRYFLEGDHLEQRAKNRGASSPCIYIFIIDGPLDDFSITIDYLKPIADAMIAQQRMERLIFVGFGENFLETSQGQIHALAGFSGSSDPPVVISLVARDLSAAIDNIQEAIMSHVALTYQAAVYDQNRRLVRSFSTGLPGSFQFYLPAGSNAFMFELQGRLYSQALRISPP